MNVQVPDDVLDKLKYLCKSIAKDEWSGVLFYSIDGTIKNVSTFKIILKDILLMDKGTAAYTSFDWDEDIIEYRMNNPESLDWLMGHIHSHNTMNVFFSGTDWSELEDNYESHNFYLSMIVNNYMDMIAKIAFTADPVKFSCKDADGKDYILSLKSSNLEPLMMVYDCELHYANPPIEVPENFSQRVELIKNKVKVVPISSDNTKSPVSLPASSKLFNDVHYPDYSSKEWEGANKSKLDNYTSYRNIPSSKKEKEERDEEFGLEKPSISEQFTTLLIRLGNEFPEDSLEDALSDLVIDKSITIPALRTSILENYAPLYDKFFSSLKVKGHETNSFFLSVLDKVISHLEEWEEYYKFLSAIISDLKMMGNKFELLEKETPQI